jgi:nucleoside-diphosphate-sugar epimerase
MRDVSVFGCGWVGKALIPALETDFNVNCLVRSNTSYISLSIKNRFLYTTSECPPNKFCHADVMIIAIPPKEYYLNTLKRLCYCILPSTHLILLSSTSVYGQIDGTVDETDTDKITSPSLMLQAEYLVRSLREDALILRLGGLMGYERIAGKYTQGRTKTHDTFVNYIHRDDVVNVITCCIQKELRGDIFNVVAPKHPKQSEIYRQNAKRFGFDKTYYKSQDITGKKVLSTKLINSLGYDFLRPDPLKFWT